MSLRHPRMWAFSLKIFGRPGLSGSTLVWCLVIHVWAEKKKWLVLTVCAQLLQNLETYVNSAVYKNLSVEVDDISKRWFGTKYLHGISIRYQTILVIPFPRKIETTAQCQKTIDNTICHVSLSIVSNLPEMVDGRYKVYLRWLKSWVIYVSLRWVICKGIVYIRQNCVHGFSKLLVV